ncbi:MAG: hypothetical protein RL630_846, partial [Verrucomicrobiota bacterium]
DSAASRHRLSRNFLIGGRRLNMPRIDIKMGFGMARVIQPFGTDDFGLKEAMGFSKRYQLSEAAT